MKLPDMPRDGVPVKDTVKSIIDYLRATKLRGKGIRESPNGTTITYPNQVRNPIQRKSIKRLVLASGTAANKIRVTNGLVNDQTPTLGGTALDADPAPEITISADTWIWIKVVGVFSGPTYTITIETSATSSPPAGTAISTTGFTSYRLIGSVEFASSTATIVSNRGGGDLSVDSFGSANFWWLT